MNNQLYTITVQEYLNIKQLEWPNNHLLLYLKLKKLF